MAKVAPKGKETAAKAAPKKTAKAAAPRTAKAAPRTAKAAAKPAAAKATKPARTAKKKVKSGDRYACEVCGLVVSVDEACGCVDACDIICCGEEMTARK